MHLLPKVFRTEGDMVDFNPSKIQDSLIKETGMSDNDAKKITELTVRRIISSGIEFLSGPHIREVVCSILSEQHFEQERKYYTRIGMPLMDYEEILEKGFQQKEYGILNPEKIHHWAADRIAEEYAHLRILNSEESKAHLFGDIYIHNLKYFDLRPMNQIWDPRIILKNGLPPVSSWTHCSKSGPAGVLAVAVNHLAKWLGMTQGEFSGAQGFNFITTLLAPYAKGLNDEEIKQAMQSLIYEINQLSAVIGREIPITSISCSPEIIEPFADIPAIGAYGAVKGVYNDYQEECINIFKTLIEIFNHGDHVGKPFEYPKYSIYFTEKGLENNKSTFSKLWEDFDIKSAPILVNLCSNWLNNKIKTEFNNKDFSNNGTLQSICLNLPRYAFISKDESEFLEIVEDTINFCSGILLKKYEIIKKRLVTQHLPLCSGVIDGIPLFNLDKQSLAIDFVGLNEAVKSLSDYELHEHKTAAELGFKIIEAMVSICSKMSERDSKMYILQENPSNLVRSRFASLDLKHFSKLQSSELGAYYTNSTHFREGVIINMPERIQIQGKFHQLIKNNLVEEISLKGINSSDQSLNDFIQGVCKSSNIGSLKFSE